MCPAREGHRGRRTWVHHRSLRHAGAEEPIARIQTGTGVRMLFLEVCSVGMFVPLIIGFIEGFIYLSMSDRDLARKYGWCAFRSVVSHR